MNQTHKVMENKTLRNMEFRISGFGFWGSSFDIRCSSFDIRHLKFRFKLSDFSFLISAFLLSSLFSIQVEAQTLDDYLIQAAENNPGLKSKYAQYLASVERISQPGLPDPEFQVGVFIEPMERYMGNQSADYRIMQMFPWFGSIKTQKEEAKHMSLASYQLFLESKNQLFYEIKSTWFDLHRIKGEIDITYENLDYLRKLEILSLSQFQAATGASSAASPTLEMAKPATTMTSSGSGMNGMSSYNSSPSPTMPSNPSGGGMGNAGSGMTEVLQIRLEIKELENQLSLLKSNLKSQSIKFNQLINREIDTEIELGKKLVPAILELEKTALLDSIRKNNPMLAMYEEESLAYEQKAKMAQLDGNPMIGVGVNYIPFIPRVNDGIDHSMHSMNMVMPMFTMTLPFYRHKTDSRIKEAKFLQESASLNRQQTENLLAMQWANAIRQWEDASGNLRLYEEQVELVQQQINLLTTSFSAGSETLSSILRSQQRIIDYQIQRLNAINQQYQSLALLEALSGLPLISN
jgi:outer membrane protein TolC